MTRTATDRQRDNDVIEASQGHVQEIERDRHHVTATDHSRDHLHVASHHLLRQDTPRLHLHVVVLHRHRQENDRLHQIEVATKSDHRQESARLLDHHLVARSDRDPDHPQEKHRGHRQDVLLVLPHGRHQGRDLIHDLPRDTRIVHHRLREDGPDPDLVRRDVDRKLVNKRCINSAMYIYCLSNNLSTKS